MLLDKLPPDVAEAIKLKYIKEYSNEEIAQELGCKPTDVWYKVSKGKNEFFQVTTADGITLDGEAYGGRFYPFEVINKQPIEERVAEAPLPLGRAQRPRRRHRRHLPPRLRRLRLAGHRLQRQQVL